MVRTLRRRAARFGTAFGLLALCLLVSIPTVQAQGGQFFDSNGVQIHYVDQGAGEPVVLVHGFLASYVGNWETPGIMKALGTAGYRVIALDYRGHGQSGKPHGPEHYGLEMVGDVVGLLDHLNIERAHVVGYSMGGMITNKLRANHSDRLLTATLGGFGWAGEGEDLTERIANTRRRADGIENRDMGPLMRRLAPLGVKVNRPRFVRELVS